MSESNKAIVRRWYDEVWNRGNQSITAELFAPEGEVFGFPEPTSVLTGPEAFSAAQRPFLAAFPDVHVTIDEMVAEGDIVAMRWTATGTHTGAHLGFPATGQSATLAGSSFFHLRSGKILRGYTTMDFTRFMMQLRAAAPKA